MSNVTKEFQAGRTAMVQGNIAVKPCDRYGLFIVGQAEADRV
ncbi:hypothetical protein RAS12_03800 [Achromobacter seleniivolatilans]|uniref:Uncharacterized protein n=1 Tax=Achromobacter seleniivolatilans TaxID=3047478 RepID=A0ABY9M3C8_9BURK|nr:hypothetical protein [Achromobacter sp. R39]WMD21506.1 hypothetical protein RAS12_03800 [Achromobacter sp. R39]